MIRLIQRNASFDAFHDADRNNDAAQAIRAEIMTGLLAAQASVAPKFLYDALGSRLFEAICELPEYYLTRTEAAIFEEYLSDIAQTVGTGVSLIDLGAGNCGKAAKLIPALQPSQYVPVDISVEFLQEAVRHLHLRFPELDIVALGCDFSSDMELPSEAHAERRLFFYPGSSIGNFTQTEAAAFLKRLRHACGPQGEGKAGVLIGVDLVKEKSLLHAAYDDVLGVTSAFNLNLLLHINRLIGADFNPRDWQHRGVFNAALSRVEMHLAARTDVTVRWPQGKRSFREGDTIHTESSYKYTPSAFLALLEEAGFGRARTWFDAHGWYMVCYAQAI